MASSKRSDGEGSIFFDQSKGRWVGVLIVGWRDGKPVRRKVTASSRPKAAARLRELREKATAGTLAATRPPTVQEWMEYWLESIIRPNRRRSTYEGYRSKADQYIIPMLGHHRLDRLTPEHVEQAWEELIEVGNPLKAKTGAARPLSTTTAHGAHQNLRRALVVAMQRGKVARNVCTLIEAPAIAETDIHPLSRDEARRVLACAEDARNGARWTVALALGLRQGEALGLMWDDIDLQTGRTWVRRALARVPGEGLVLGAVKSKAARRDIVLPAELLNQMRLHRKQQAAERIAAGSWWQDNGLVFCQPNGKPIDPARDWQNWQDICAEAGTERHYRLHDARHTAATLLLLQGIDAKVVAGILGHSQVSMTRKYQHVVDEMKQSAAQAMNAALWG